MERLILSAAPHIRSRASTRTIMGDVLIALLPAVVASVVFFGPRALLLEACLLYTSLRNFMDFG